KRLIAEKLARRVAPNQTLFMDTGSTTLICAQALEALEGVRVITNSARIAAASAGEVFLIGGRYDRDNAEALGPTAIEAISQFNADSAVITIGALSAEYGATDYNFDEAQIARAMIARARRLIVVADASKFDSCVSFEVCPLARIDLLITDQAPGQELSTALAAAEVEVA
nr:DeoR/GlpR transcriptional regulator [Paracoccaceae bacterium]